MTLSDFYKAIVRFGIEADPRKNKNAISFFEDSAILYGDPASKIKKILVGIDIETPELILADRIREKNGLDLAMAHHPEGFAFASLWGVMAIQTDLLENAGIDRAVALNFIEERIREVQRGLLPANHTRASDAAKLLDMPFICCHTPADNHVSEYINNLLIKEKPFHCKDILDILNSEPEYAFAKKNHAGPALVMGNPHRPVGKFFIEMTGGTEGPKNIYKKLYDKGVRTIISMHVSGEHFKKVQEAHLNVIVAGHISSDTLGMNLMLDKLEKLDNLDIVCCSGFTRFKRK